MNCKWKSRRRFYLHMRSRTPPIFSEFRGGLNTPNPPPLGTPLSPRVVANGGDGFQTCANIFNKEKRTSDKRWFFSLWGGQGQILTCHEMGWKAWKLYRFLERSKRRKCTWDLELEMWRFCIGQGHLKTAARELAKYKLDLVGAQEVRWDKGGTKRAMRIISQEQGFLYVHKTIRRWVSRVC